MQKNSKTQSCLIYFPFLFHLLFVVAIHFLVIFFFFRLSTLCVFRFGLSLFCPPPPLVLFLIKCYISFLFLLPFPPCRYQRVFSRLLITLYTSSYIIYFLLFSFFVPSLVFFLHYNYIKLSYTKSGTLCFSLSLPLFFFHYF